VPDESPSQSKYGRLWPWRKSAGEEPGYIRRLNECVEAARLTGRAVTRVYRSRAGYRVTLTVEPPPWTAGK
jgi:hypothetical protein